MILRCPVCKKPLFIEEKSYKCESNHCFDISKDGYVNLLIGSKSGDKKGDSKDSARARHSFLNKGYYSCLKDAIAKRLKGTVLDICCGEGYYDEYGGSFYGFDISKEMVRLAAKSHKADNYKYFTANLSSIPINDESVDTAIHLFAPFNEKEFSRVLKKSGRLYSVIPGENHLFELKEVLYDKPYKNDEAVPDAKSLKLISKEKISRTLEINKEDLHQLFSMTPYFYRTSDADKAKLNDVASLNLTVEFVILEYSKEE